MKVIINILISVLSFAISYGIAHLTGSVIVKNAVLLAYVIHWIAYIPCLLYTSPSPRDAHESRMPSSA